MSTDEYPRAGTTADKLAGLRPAFKKDGSVTAGNASGINDGAAAVVVAANEKARVARHKRPRARFSATRPPVWSRWSWASAPCRPSARRSNALGLRRQDIALFELNEAFAAQSIAVVRELGLDPAKVNVNGGAIALGHPIGASGARVLTTLIYALQKRGGGRGVAALCIGGGMGIAMVVEV